MKTFAIVLGLAGVASAEPAVETSRFVEGGMAFGAAEPVIGWNLMATVAGGYRISGPWWLHAAYAYGPTIDNLGAHRFNRGRNMVLHAGAEGRWCSSRDGALCGIAGLDLGGQYGTWQQPDNPYVMPSTSSTAFLAIPHVGLDAGTPRIRARLDLDADAALVARHSATGIIGIELAAGVWVAW